MKLYCIVDVKHGQALTADEAQPGSVAHRPPSESLRAQWSIETAGDGTFFIRDALLRRYLAAGDAYDGRLYHLETPEGSRARWQFFPMFDGPGGDLAVTIKDAKHHLAIVAADGADGTLTHDAPNGRMNAFWTLVCVADR